MAGVITAVEVQAKRRNRVNVYLDRAFAFGLTNLVAEQAGLRPGLFLSDEQIQRLLSAEAMQQALDTALAFLSYRPRSESEVRRNLSSKKIPEPLIDEVLARLRASGLIDDAAFARYWAENRETFSPRGQRLLKAELRQKGISPDTIAETLEASEVDELSGAYRVAEKKARSLRNLDKRTFWQRLSAHLARRGFDYEVIHEVVSRLWREMAPDQALADRDSDSDTE